MNRRDFLKSSGAVCGISALGTLAFLESCQKDNTSTTPQGPNVNFTIDLTQPIYSALNNSGGSVALNGVVIANIGTSIVAIAQKCTHNGCSIGYNSAAKDFVCPCHGGTFDLNGNVTAGPPPSPLKVYTVTKNGDILTISG
jgi:cytochrome b6-f complex iron-sulfur subunit